LAFPAKILIGAAFLGLSAIAAAMPARADATLLIEAQTGKVLHAENATYPWYPASLTKLMTLYVTLQALREKRITGDTMVTVSARASSQAPAKMGFNAGTQLTLDNALKMLMVKSANDMAVTIAEGVSGSIEQFADDMNTTANRLGMVQSSYVNPNGLPADNQISSARDLGILARSLIRDFPEYSYYWHLPGIKFGKRITRNYNKLLTKYPGSDGMKTGYICASGFNLVATATRNGRQLIAVVLGAPSSAQRAEKAAQLLERGFSGDGLSWLRPSLGTVDALVPIAAAPPNLRDQMCGPHRKKPASETDDDNDDAVATNDKGDGGSLMSLRQATPKFSLAALPDFQIGEPVDVFVGAPKPPGAPPAAKPAAAPAQAAIKPAAPVQPARPVPVPRPAPAPKPTTAAVKPADAKPVAAKPVAIKPAAVKPAAAKPATAKPATPKPAATKPAPEKPAAAKPAQPPA
jgi:D-alanyl-D-alanine carboxypeptidase